MHSIDMSSRGLAKKAMDWWRADGRPDGARAAGDRNAPAGEHAARLDARVLVLVRVLHLFVLT